MDERPASWLGPAWRRIAVCLQHAQAPNVASTWATAVNVIITLAAWAARCGRYQLELHCLSHQRRGATKPAKATRREVWPSAQLAPSENPWAESHPRHLSRKATSCLEPSQGFTGTAKPTQGLSAQLGRQSFENSVSRFTLDLSQDVIQHFDKLPWRWIPGRRVEH